MKMYGCLYFRDIKQTLIAEDELMVGFAALVREGVINAV